MCTKSNLACTGGGGVGEGGGGGGGREEVVAASTGYDGVQAGGGLRLSSKRFFKLSLGGACAPSLF
jgi:hypothetical protein